MNIPKVLEYQKKDFEIIKLERILNASENKKIINQMVQKVKDSQNKSLQLEKLAEDLNREFLSLQQSYEENSKKFDEISKKDFKNLSEEEISSFETLTQSILANLAVLDKKFVALAERINKTLSQFEQAKKDYGLAREKHKKHKEMFEVEAQKIQPKIDSLRAELDELEKDLDKDVVAKYKQRRQDKIFPILVPLNNNSCGGCQMELSIAFIDKLKEKGYGECENCRRVIYIS